METEEERQARRRARLEEMRREKRRRELLYKWGIPVLAGLAVAIGIGIGIGTAAFSHRGRGQGEAQNESMELVEGQDSAATKDSTVEPENTQKTDPASADRRKSQQARKDPVMVEGKTYLPRSFFGQEDLQTEVPGQSFAPAPTPTPVPLGTASPAQNAVFELSENTQGFSETILSKYGIFIDMESGEILAQRDAYVRMNPASMTKMLTVLVAAEHLTEEDLEKTAPITIDITDYSFSNGCSNTGYELDEEVTVRDLFYGTILPSGADSAVALAKYVAGSHEAFVEMMNEKLIQMGLGDTSHFTNCVGVYDTEHYSTAYDMAVILKATVDNPFCREVMAAHTYNTSLTKEHPEGLLISNWFLRRIEDRDTHGEVLCAKTGYVDQSGRCAASLGLDKDGKADTAFV